MLRAALGFWILALVSIVLGAFGVAGISFDVGRALWAVFLVLAAFSFIVGLATSGGRR